MAEIPKLPDFIRRRITQAMDEPVRGMTLGDGKVRVLGADLSYLLRLIDAHEAGVTVRGNQPENDR